MNLNIRILVPTLVLLLCGCNADTIAVPDLSISDVKAERNGQSETTFNFQINISPKSSEIVTVNYKTIDGTALAGKDYLQKNGILTIAPNQSTAILEITVLKSNLRAVDQMFSVVLSKPQNAGLSNQSTAIGTIQNTGTYLPVDGSGYQTALTYPGKQLIWSDEFEGNEINTSNWTTETGGSGWGNNELQYYTNSSKNAFVSNGFLVIEARNETMGSNHYTSARLISKDKKTFTYGRIDFRAKLPKGQGIWPALWMLGNNISSKPWPSCGEIDIMELLGHEAQKTYGTTHWGAAGGPSTHIGGNHSLASSNFNEQFHVFSLEWDANQLRFLVDDIPYFTTAKSQVNGDYPFDKPFFFIMNVAVGGNWPGNPNYTTLFPQQMLVDYVRVYQ